MKKRTEKNFTKKRAHKKHTRYSEKIYTDKKRSVFESIIKVFISLSAPVIIGIVITYYFWPFFTKTEIDISTTDFGQANGGEELIPVMNENQGCIEIYLHNDNNGLMRIENIYINVCDFDELKDISFPDIGGQGGLEEPIPLKGIIDPDNPRSKAEINYDLLDDNTNKMQYISLGANTADKFILSPQVKREGIYEINVEFEYYYHGKTHRINTENIKFIWTNPLQENSSETKVEITTSDDAEKTSYAQEEFWNGPFDWRTGYEEALKNITNYLPINDRTECSLKDLNFDNIPELHIVTMIGAKELLGDAVIFYYDENNNLTYTKHQYNLGNLSSPQLFVNENGEYAWLTGYWEMEYEDESEQFDGSPFTKDWILYQGTDVRKINFDGKQITEEVLVSVEGQKWNVVEPVELYFYGKTYNDIDLFLDELKSTWQWRPVKENNVNIYLYPFDRSVDSQTIHEFLEIYHPLF